MSRKMVRHISTSISDAVLTYASFHAAYRTMSLSMSAAIGFLIIGVAAFLGTIKFALREPSTDLVSYHKFLSWLGSAVAIPYIAAGYHRQENSLFQANLHLATGFALVALQNFLSEKVKGLATEAVSSYAIISTLILSLFKGNSSGIVGTVCYIAAGLVVKTDGFWFGVPRVDIFHYVLVIANIALMQGLRQGPEPIYYKPPVKA